MRTLSSDWVETTAAAQALGLRPKFMSQTLRHQLKAGTHYRCKNPKAAERGRRYLWNLPKVEAYLNAL
jgi:hypothetical protein